MAKKPATTMELLIPKEVGFRKNISKESSDSYRFPQVSGSGGRVINIGAIHTVEADTPPEHLSLRK